MECTACLEVCKYFLLDILLNNSILVKNSTKCTQALLNHFPEENTNGSVVGRR